MKTINYGHLFEGKFKVTRDFKKNWLTSLYYQISPSTYGDRIIFSYMKKYLHRDTKYKILDLGCGGGHQGLLSFGEVTGVDVSRSSLKNAEMIYKNVIVTDATKLLPFPNESFDVVFCFEVFGHISIEDKDDFLGEVSRVLRPGGLVFWSIETKGNNITVKLLERMNYYRELWVDYQGHIGLESPKATLKRLQTFFTLHKWRSVSSDVLVADGYLNFVKRFPIFRLFANKWLRYATNIVLAPFFYLITSSSPLERSNDLIVVVQK